MTDAEFTDAARRIVTMMAAVAEAENHHVKTWDERALAFVQLSTSISTIIGTTVRLYRVEVRDPYAPHACDACGRCGIVAYAGGESEAEAVERLEAKLQQRIAAARAG